MYQMQSGMTELTSGGLEDLVSSCRRFHLDCGKNFGGINVLETGRAVVRRAFDRGVTHFDLANNYGTPYGAAEENFGEILRKDFRGLRNELLISTKAGWDMWPGPSGEAGSRKYMLASPADSLKRMGLEYVDIFAPTVRPWTFLWKRPWAPWCRRCVRSRPCMRVFHRIVRNGRKLPLKQVQPASRPASVCNRSFKGRQSHCPHCIAGSSIPEC
jgi:Aldo/keto reductase family